MNHSAPLPTEGWTDERQAEIARKLDRSEAQIHAGQTVPLAPLLDELRALADRLEATEQHGTASARR